MKIDVISILTGLILLLYHLLQHLATQKPNTDLNIYCFLTVIQLRNIIPGCYVSRHGDNLLLTNVSYPLMSMFNSYIQDLAINVI